MHIKCISTYIHWHPLPAHINDSDNANVMHVSVYICAAHFADAFEQHAQAQHVAVRVTAPGRRIVRH